jgi:hypothetical protein
VTPRERGLPCVIGTVAHDERGLGWHSAST